MNILLVQPYDDQKYSYQKLYEKILKIIENHSVDLVVFPESFSFVENIDDAWTLVENVADFLKKPVICGLSYPDGTERALYMNWTPVGNDTTDSIYIKHSTSESTAFDFETEILEEANLYKPIYLNGQRIQVYICHDMYFPLITERLEQEGLDILINLTGGNVKMSKWCNVLKGRSNELNSFVLCTMSNRISMKQASDRIAYYAGKKLKANYSQGNGESAHAFSIFSTEDPIQETKIEETLYSDKIYSQFTIGMGCEADCWIVFDEQTIYSELPKQGGSEFSIQLVKDNETVHVHVANYDEIFDRTYLYKESRVDGENHVVIYLSEDDVNEEEAIAMLKLRAIENRIGCIVAAKNCFIGAKTNRYKDIQLFNPTNNKIGFDLQFMQGIDSIFQKTASIQGISVKHKDAYLSLVSLEEQKV